MKLKTLAPWKKSYDQPRQHILKNRDINLPTNVHLVKAMVFPVVMYGCESWTIKKAEPQRINTFVVLEKTLESPLDCKEINQVNPKGHQPWIFIRRTDAEAEAPTLWPPDEKCWLIGKDRDAGKDWRQEEKVRWRTRWLDGIINSVDEFEQSPENGEGQGSLACCSPRGHKVSDTTGRLDNNNYWWTPRMMRVWHQPRHSISVGWMTEQMMSMKVISKYKMRHKSFSSAYSAL